MPRGSIAVATVFVALLVVTPGSAVAAHVTCGDVITKDTTLDAGTASWLLRRLAQGTSFGPWAYTATIT
jgi:hypothetical protein